MHAPSVDLRERLDDVLRRGEQPRIRRRRGKAGELPPDPVAQADARVDAKDRAREAERRLLDAVQKRVCRDRKTVLDILLVNDRISRAQFFAGEQVASLWTRCGFRGRVTANYGVTGGGGGSSGYDAVVDRLTAGAIDARRKLGRVLEPLLEAERAEVGRVCGHEEAPRSLAVLADGLDKVALGLRAPRAEASVARPNEALAALTGRAR